MEDDFYFVIIEAINSPPISQLFVRRANANRISFLFSMILVTLTIF